MNADDREKLAAFEATLKYVRETSIRIELKLDEFYQKQSLINDQTLERSTKNEQILANHLTATQTAARREDDRLFRVNTREVAIISGVSALAGIFIKIVADFIFASFS